MDVFGSRYQPLAGGTRVRRKPEERSQSSILTCHAAAVVALHCAAVARPLVSGQQGELSMKQAMTDDVEPNRQDLAAAAAAVRKGILPAVPAIAEDERVHVYIDAATGREFDIREHSVHDDKVRLQRRYFVCELVPNGRLAEERPDGSRRYWSDERITELEREHGPNALVPRLRELGIPVERMVLIGAGASVDARYHASLEECAAAIARALADNKRYKPRRELTEQERTWQARLEARQSHAHWEAELAGAEAAEAEHGLFKGCRSMLGPLSPEAKTAILDYLNAPSLEKWLQVRGLVVTGFDTLWRAWIAFDASAPRSDDGRYPEPEVLRQALRAAVESRERKIRERLAKTHPTRLTVVGPPPADSR